MSPQDDAFAGPTLRHNISESPSTGPGTTALEMSPLPVSSRPGGPRSHPPRPFADGGDNDDDNDDNDDFAEASINAPLLSPRSSPSPPPSSKLGDPSAGGGRRLIPSGRRTLGFLLLAAVVVLWVSSSFLTYAIFSDDTYSKPYFVVYINTSIFIFYLIPYGVRHYLTGSAQPQDPSNSDKMTTKETMRLSAEFCLLWFIANYLATYCLAFTSVASATILSNTSSMFTLLIAVVMKVERFTFTKLLSVVASLIGISLISTTDISPSPSPTSTGRTHLQVLLGDAMALLSAVAYAFYITLFKHRVGSESRVNMTLFFGFVGLFNVICLWPGIILLHVLGAEEFGLPDNGRVWVIVIANALITLTSDYCWAYATLLTTPVMVTVGLSMTIPLALLGQMVLLGQVAGGWYWVGAGCVFAAFWVLTREEGRKEDERGEGREEGRGEMAGESAA